MLTYTLTNSESIDYRLERRGELRIRRDRHQVRLQHHFRNPSDMHRFIANPVVSKIANTLNPNAMISVIRSICRFSDTVKSSVSTGRIVGVMSCSRTER